MAFSPYDAAFASLYSTLGGANAPTMGAGSREETRTYAPFQTTKPSPDYADLIGRYQGLLGGGTGSFTDLINLQREKGLERLRNTRAARGVSARSPVQAAAAGEFLSGFEPQAAAMQAQYMMDLLGRYASAVSQGATSFAPIMTGLSAKTEQPLTGGGVSYGGGGGGSAAPGGAPSGSVQRNRATSASEALSTSSPFYGPSGDYGSDRFLAPLDRSVLQAGAANPYADILGSSPAGGAPTIIPQANLTPTTRATSLSQGQRDVRSQGYGGPWGYYL